MVTCCCCKMKLRTDNIYAVWNSSSVKAWDMKSASSFMSCLLPLRQEKRNPKPINKIQKEAKTFTCNVAEFIFSSEWRELSQPVPRSPLSELLLPSPRASPGLQLSSSLAASQAPVTQSPSASSPADSAEPAQSHTPHRASGTTTPPATCQLGIWRREKGIPAWKEIHHLPVLLQVDGVFLPLDLNGIGHLLLSTKTIIFNSC